MQKKRKIVIIGGGVSGLTAAVYAAMQGYETALYEKHTLVGGECTGWDRQGYHIDNCIHWLMGSTPGTDLNRLWNAVGALGENVEMHRMDRMYVSELDGQTLSLWSDIDRTEAEMIALSPADEKEIRALMKNCRLAKDTKIPARTPSELMGPLDGARMALTMGSTLKVIGAYQGMDVRDLTMRFRHPLIRCAISDFTPLCSQASSFPMAYGNFVSGDGGVPAGGSRAMAMRMKARAESLGAKIFCGRSAEKLLLSGDAAKSLLLDDGEEVAGDYFIPACDASYTFGRLLPVSYRDPVLTEMFEKREAYPVFNTFQTALAVDDPCDEVGVEHIYDCPELVFTPGMGERLTVKSYAYEPGFAPAGKQILQTLQGGSEDVFAFWTALYQDPAAYREKKREIAEQTRAAIEKRIPAYRGKLSVLDAWTPKTYARYTNAFKGFYQSCMVTKQSRKLPYPPAWVQGLSNVVLSGQWISPPGGLPGAAITGKFAIQRIVRRAGDRAAF